jgi:polyhydroxyalkanoate synthesis regulator phasin
MTMRSRLTVLTVLLAASLAAFAYTEETLQELVARAEAARPEDRPGLYIEVAERHLKTAAELYRSGKSEDARQAVNDVVTYSQKAHDASAQTGKRLKNTEIAFRKMAARLRDIKTTLNFEDQAPVQAAADHLEDLRTDLMSRIWGKGK